MLRECMRCSLSAIDDLEAGTSMAPVGVSPGTGRVWEKEPLLSGFCTSTRGTDDLLPWPLESALRLVSS